MAAGPVTLPHWMFGGLGSQVQVLKAGVPQVAFKPPQGEAPVFLGSPGGGTTRRGEVYRFEVTGVARSYPPALMRAFFFAGCAGVRLFSGFFSEDFVPCVAVHSGCLSEVVPFRPLLRRHLRPELYLSPHNLPEGFYYLQSIKPCTC